MTDIVIEMPPTPKRRKIDPATLSPVERERREHKLSRMRSYNRTYEVPDKEKRRADQAARRATPEGRAAQRESARRHYVNNTDKVCASVRRYRTENREQVLASKRVASAKLMTDPERRARKAAEGRARRAANLEKHRERGRKDSRKSYAKHATSIRTKARDDFAKTVTPVSKTICAVFEALRSDAAREEYSHWVLFLADFNIKVRNAVQTYAVDDHLGTYSGI